ncbi:hypothetical protein IE81DRAFT_319132 [Ceraceosorus guamensis]|uniref:pH-response regulator protein palC n=1 Tax=Ceraceosorus guamensis TaxID=1522189 RepID=A0A316W8U6_9BASI|nr:hypothetical protein IE81DRAFT_319132 [Ceraceosorus guamensis]PWN46252.1 hypothetical protein IE81DRAFT_319132 [Ceraceosorus guamensis]
MYVHILPTTGAISFQDFLQSGTTLTSELARTTELRASLRSILKEQRHEKKVKVEDNDGDEREAKVTDKDWFRIVKAVDEYLPHLFGIFNCVQTDDLLLRHEPQFSWRTTLSSSSFMRDAPRVTLPGLHYELCSVLLLSGTALSNLAASYVASLGDYERDRLLTTEQRKAKDERLRIAADLLCKAAGIFEYLGEDLIPQWETVAGKIDGRPPDVTREVTLAMSKLAMADAESLAVRKLLSPFLSTSLDTITPGPPLPKTHPSASLLAKLNLNVCQRYEQARSLAQVVGKKPSMKNVDNLASEADGLRRPELRAGNAAFGSVGIDDDARLDSAVGGKGGHQVGSKFGGGLLGKLKPSVSSDRPSSGSGGGAFSLGADEDLSVGSLLLKYLATRGLLAKARAYKWLGIDSGEAGRYGDAIPFLRTAKEILEDELSTIRRFAHFRDKKGRDAREELKKEREDEFAIVNHWLASYIKLNDTVAFQPLTKSTEISTRIPAGRSALVIKHFNPPVPAFGPGSPGYISENMKRLGVGNETQESHGAMLAIDRSSGSPSEDNRLDLGEVVGVIRPKPKDQERDYAHSMPGYY